MSSILRSLGAGLACLSALALSACGSSIPETKIGNTSVGRYVALGDGFAAAPDTGPTSKDGCRRSATDYPSQLAKRVKAKQLVDVTCTFATTGDVVGAHRHGGRVVPAQIDAVSKRTDVVTLTVGISDRDFLRRVFRVCTEDPCPSSDGVPTDRLASDLGQISDSIKETISAIVKKAPNARLYVVGYPQILPRSGTCSAMPDLTQAQADAINAAITQLDANLRVAARLNHSYYVDTLALSTGHDLCSDEPWVEGVKGGPGAPPRFHPKAALSAAIAEELAGQLLP